MKTTFCANFSLAPTWFQLIRLGALHFPVVLSYQAFKLTVLGKPHGVSEVLEGRRSQWHQASRVGPHWPPEEEESRLQVQLYWPAGDDTHLQRLRQGLLLSHWPPHPLDEVQQLDLTKCGHRLTRRMGPTTTNDDDDCHLQSHPC